MKDVRINKKLTQEQLALLTGLSQSFVSDIEIGVRTPSLDTINRIAYHLKINPFTLLKLKHSNKPNLFNIL